MSVDEDGPALPLPVLCNACGRALANVGEWCCGRFTTAADVVMSDGIIRELCNAVEPVPGPLPARCSRPRHDDEDHDWVPGAEVRHRTELAQNALATESAAAISATRAGAGARLPGKGVVRRIAARWNA